MSYIFRRSDATCAAKMTLASHLRRILPDSPIIRKTIRRAKLPPSYNVPSALIFRGPKLPDTYAEYPDEARGV